jgi:Ca2+-binding EF-hand superfamily protein
MYTMGAANSQMTRSGKANITQDDLSQMESQMETLGMDVPDFLSQIQANFDKIDVNGDGISSDELQTYAKANGLKLPGQNSASGMNGGTPPVMSKDDLTKMRDEMSANGDSAADGITQLIDNFDSADTDQDGMVSFDEAQAYAEANNITSMLQGPPPPQGAAGMNGGPPPAMSKDDLTKMRDDMSANGDSAADGITQLIDNFDSADTDQDGMVSFEEMQAYATANNITSLLQGPGATGGAHAGMSKDDLTKMHNDLTSAADGVSEILDQFDAADTNKDGEISVDEMQALAASTGATTVSSTSSDATSTTSTSTTAAKTTAATSQSTGTQQADLMMMLMQQRSLSAYGTYAGVTSANSYLGAGLMA